MKTSKLFLGILVVVFFGFAIAALKLPLLHAYTLPDTGQTKCYDNSQEIPCPNPGEAFYGQDAQYQGPQSAYRDNGDGTVTDLNTGLMWQQGDDRSKRTSWEWAMYYCTTLDLAGHSDWRLPTRRELMSLVDYSIPSQGPTIDTAYFPECTTGHYTSSSTFAPHGVWLVDFSDGKVLIAAKSWSTSVRCVRGDSLLKGNYLDNGDGTISDTATGLVWQQTDDGVERNWKQAMTFCECLNLAGRNDWRLPNIRELESIVDESRGFPACEPPFQCRNLHYWSGSTNACYPVIAWAVSFGHGTVDELCYKRYTYNIRCVRSGPSPLTIAQTPMSGPPGTTFVQWGKGFSPNSTATLHLKKPFGTKCPEMTVDLDTIGYFENSNTVPSDEPTGKYTWWAIDDTTGSKSNEVTYEVSEEGAAPDLSITKMDASNPVVVGTNLTYTVQIDNAGPASATGVVVTDTLPSGVTFISATASQGSCVRTERELTCTLGEMAAGKSADVRIVVQPKKAKTITNTATVASNESDPNTANNSATATTAVKPFPTLTIRATDPQATEAGRTKGQFTIYRNGGGKSVPLVVNYFVSGTATNGADYAALSGTCTIPAGGSKAVINVKPVNDKFYEGGETVVLTLVKDAGYLIGSPNTATVTIADNDLPAVSITAADAEASQSDI